MSDSQPALPGVVSTIGAKCRRCYNCVRSCPAKAIRVQDGQAWVLEDRCIGCGNCLKVCGQDAKQVRSATAEVAAMLAEPSPVVAIVAPSYPAAFDQVSAGQFVTALRALGFAQVMEVGFGAEMVAAQYSRLLADPPNHPVLTTPCPALVSYVQKYMPDLVPYLAPIVSPMVAMGRAVKQHYQPGARVVFIGPCVAKKAEEMDTAVAGAVDAVMTFQELSLLLGQRAIVPESLAPSEPDPPLPHYGALFPVPGGLLKTAAIPVDLMDDAILVVEGPERCLTALRELQAGNYTAQFLDMLFCEGCIAGPSFAGNMSSLARRERVTAHVRHLAGQAGDPAAALAAVAGVDISRSFEAKPIIAPVPNERELRDILARSSKLSPEDELNCGACGYATCRDKAIAVYQGLAEPEMCLPYLIDQLQVNLEKLSRSKEEIEKARELAAQAQQLASMGQLAADIAEEIDSPLTQVVVFAQLLRDGMSEDDPRREEVAAIVAEALHCRQVMSGLQGFARQRRPQWEEARLEQIVQEAVAELQPQLAGTQIQIKVDLSPDLPALMADPALLRQALVNLLSNSVEAIRGPGHIVISVHLTEDQRALNLQVRDDGVGIPPQLLSQVLQPFVTTKHDQRGAGLGLAVAHGVVRAHDGEISLQSEPGQGATVTIRLPLNTGPRIETPEAAKVLIVDDDPDFLEAHRLMLSAVGYNVITAERSDEAIEISNREIPDAFILDMMMEKTDSGARLARALRRDPRFRHSPILMLTSVGDAMGFEFDRNPHEVMEWTKVDAWFAKPAPITEMVTTLQRLLAGNEEEATTTPAQP